MQYGKRIIIVALGVLGTSGIATAQVEINPQQVPSLTFHDGNNAGPRNRVRGNGHNRGSGVERPVTRTLLTNTGQPDPKGRGAVLLMTSYTDMYNIQTNNIGIGNQDVVQAATATFQIDPQNGPQITTQNPGNTPLTVITNIDGDHGRTWFHPDLTALPGGAEAADRGDTNYPAYQASGNWGNNNSGDAERHAALLNYLGHPITSVNINQNRNASLVLAIDNDDCGHPQPGGPMDNSVNVVAATPGQSFTIMHSIACNGNNLDSGWEHMYRWVNNGNGWRIEGGLDIDNAQEANQARNLTNVEQDIQRYRSRNLFAPGFNGYQAQNSGIVVSDGTDGNNQPPRNGQTSAWVRFNTADLTVQKLGEQTIARGLGRGQYATNGQLMNITGPNGQMVQYMTYNNVKPQNRRGKDVKSQTTMFAGLLNYDMNGGNTATWTVQAENNVYPGTDGTHNGGCTAYMGDPTAPIVNALTVHGSHNGSPNSPTTVNVTSAVSGKPELVAKYNLPFAVDKGWAQKFWGQNPNTSGREFPTCGGNILNPGYGTGFASNVKSFVLVPAAYTAVRERGEKLSTGLAFVPAEVNGGVASLIDGPPIAGPGEFQTGGTSTFGCQAGGAGGAGGVAALLLVGLAIIGTRRRRDA